jgi:cell division protein FtsI/penicillin-binding protein 2
MSQVSAVNHRIKTAFLIILGTLFLISLRLFYWQVIRSQTLKSAASKQLSAQNTIKGQRGKIFTADNKLLVGNTTVYDLYVNKNELKIEQDNLIEQLINLFETFHLQQIQDEKNGNEEVSQNFKEFSSDEFRQKLKNALDRTSSWILLSSSLCEELKTLVESNRITGLHFIEQSVRHYPEGSMAAHITGFVGSDEDGLNVGFYGIEGALNKELKGQEKIIRYKQDAQGQQLADQKLDFSSLDGRDVTLTIRRDIQFIATEELKKGVAQTQSKKGEIVIMDPKTGAILAMATWPHYDPQEYHLTPTEVLKNPILTDLYEPGSIFKIFTIATGIDTQAITPETICDNCSGPRVFGDFAIRTWNNEYNPNISMTDALKKSDNVALVYAVEKIGGENFINYLKKFGIGDALEIDLQEDRSTPLRDKLRPVELANASFGQGFLTNSLQLVRAAGAIANQGIMMRPYIVQEVSDSQTQGKIIHEPQILKKVLEKESANTVTKMMINSAPTRGNWVDQHFLIAGKTGTAQIASSEGGYRETGTIASFLGFAPADDPKFVMIVKLTEPLLSPWAEVTAVPIWYDVADKIMLVL